MIFVGVKNKVNGETHILEVYEDDHDIRAFICFDEVKALHKFARRNKQPISYQDRSTGKMHWDVWTSVLKPVMGSMVHVGGPGPCYDKYGNVLHQHN